MASILWTVCKLPSGWLRTLHKLMVGFTCYNICVNWPEGTFQIFDTDHSCWHQWYPICIVSFSQRTVQTNVSISQFSRIIPALSLKIADPPSHFYGLLRYFPWLLSSLSGETGWDTIGRHDQTEDHKIVHRKPGSWSVQGNPRSIGICHGVSWCLI